MKELEIVLSFQLWKAKPIREALLEAGIHSLLEPVKYGFNLWVEVSNLETAIAIARQTELELLRDWDGDYGDR
jgi:hypothetical protein